MTLILLAHILPPLAHTGPLMSPHQAAESVVYSFVFIFSSPLRLSVVGRPQLRAHFRTHILFNSDMYTILHTYTVYADIEPPLACLRIDLPLSLCPCVCTHTHRVDVFCVYLSLSWAPAIFFSQPKNSHFCFSFELKRDLSWMDWLLEWPKFRILLHLLHTAKLLQGI